MLTKKRNPIEGDLIKDENGIVFDVKGIVHPPQKVVAFPRYIPDLLGDRKSEEHAYRKIYSLSERVEFLKMNFPDYLVHDPVYDELLCEVPSKAIKNHFKPVEKLRRLREDKEVRGLDRIALLLAKLLKEETGISWSSIGISGSLLVGIQTSSSDIDPIIYGSANCRSVNTQLKFMLKDETSLLKPYTQEGLQELFDFRSKDTLMSFEDFISTESRKAFQGKFLGKDYFIRFVKGLNEVCESYGDIHYKNSGYSKIKATIEDDSQSIFTPCTYTIGKVIVIDGPDVYPIQEIASFRGRFCEQAMKGERVLVQGKIEKVVNSKLGKEYFRILIGKKPSDYMKLLTTSSDDHF